MKIKFKNNKQAKKTKQQQQNVFTPKHTIINSHVNKPKFQHEHTHARKHTTHARSVLYVTNATLLVIRYLQPLNKSKPAHTHTHTRKSAGTHSDKR